MSIYSVFYDKLPITFDLLLPDNQCCKLVTFLNPYSIEIVRDRSDVYSKFDFICSDGILPMLLNSICGCSKSRRISFDMTSLAKYVFDNSTDADCFYFVGSKQNTIEQFVTILNHKYPTLKVQGFHHGYIYNEYDNVADLIIKSNANIVIVGMGTPQQDEFALFLRERGFYGTIYTCGGFFHQTTRDITYYPKWVNKFNLRALYRMYKETYVVKRVFRYYPMFILHYSFFLLRMKSKDLLKKTS